MPQSPDNLRIDSFNVSGIGLRCDEIEPTGSHQYVFDYDDGSGWGLNEVQTPDFNTFYNALLKQVIYTFRVFSIEVSTGLASLPSTEKQGVIYPAALGVFIDSWNDTQASVRVDESSYVTGPRRYRFDIAENAAFTQNIQFGIVTTFSTYTFGGLTPNTLYYVRVTTIDGLSTVISSDYSPSSSFVALSARIDPPVNLKALVAATAASLNCDPCPTEITYVRWEIAENNAFTTIIRSGQDYSGISIGILLPSTTYYARAFYTQPSMTFDGVDLSQASDTFVFTTLAFGVLAKPTLSLIGIVDVLGQAKKDITVECNDYSFLPDFVSYEQGLETGFFIPVNAVNAGPSPFQPSPPRYTWRVDNNVQVAFSVIVTTSNTVGPTGFSPVSDPLIVDLRNPPPIENAPGPYETWQPTLAPPWLQRPNGLSLNAALGYTKDLAVYDLLEALLQALPQFADTQALGLLTSDHNLERYPGESDATLRARLLGAWRFWEQAGTVPGVIEAMRQLGYLASILELRDVDIARWSEFIVIIRALPGRTLGADWGATSNPWGQPPGTLWGSGLTEQQINAIRRLLRKVKPAHTFIPNLYIVTGGALWGETGALWGDSAITWSGGGTVTIADGIGGVS